ncbi:hypothetical protein MCHI_004081 [Candidatus Magnetoovum chiemensis]|nr:hypothetical protein MCHI_004081 [Candidatus Magnetoovum chiemensis]
MIKEQVMMQSKYAPVIKKINCWEFKNCGRELGGVNADKDGICPAAVDDCLDGFHGGKNAGRACWAVAGTLCKGEPSGTFARKLKDCTVCEFHQNVILEEEHNYKSTTIYIKKIKKATKQKLLKRAPGFVDYLYAKSKKVVQEDTVIDDVQFDDLYITFLIVWASFCPSVSMLDNSKRLCKDDLIEELLIIGAIAKNPKIKATRLFLRTMFKALRRQVGNYFRPLKMKVTVKR